MPRPVQKHASRKCLGTNFGMLSGLALNMLPGSSWGPFWKSFLVRSRECFQEASEAISQSISRPQLFLNPGGQKHTDAHTKTTIEEKLIKNLRKTRLIEKRDMKTHVKIEQKRPRPQKNAQNPRKTRLLGNCKTKKTSKPT